MFDLDINGLVTFTKVKFLFTRALLLQHFNPILPLRLKTDTFIFTIEIILL